jgi:hypothetical protein
MVGQMVRCGAGALGFEVRVGLNAGCRKGKSRDAEPRSQYAERLLEPGSQRLAEHDAVGPCQFVLWVV